VRSIDCLAISGASNPAQLPLLSLPALESGGFSEDVR
jgi:hypothetical protein